MNAVFRTVVLVLVFICNNQVGLNCMQQATDTPDRFPATKALIRCLCDDVCERYTLAMNCLKRVFPCVSTESLIALIGILGVAYVCETYGIPHMPECRL